MNIKIKLIDETLPLPILQTAGAAGIDLYSRVDMQILPHTVGYIPLNIALELPEGYWVQLCARSSTHKLGLLPVNGVGVGDADYCGDNDEYLFAALNFTDQIVNVERGKRIAQLLIMKHIAAKFAQVEHLQGNDRGGFGTTGI